MGLCVEAEEEGRTGRRRLANMSTWCMTAAGYIPGLAFTKSSMQELD